MEYGGKSQVNYNTVAGSIGMAGALLGSIGNVLGINNTNPEETAVTRHELNYAQELANKDHTIAKLESQQ